MTSTNAKPRLLDEFGVPDSDEAQGQDIAPERQNTGVLPSQWLQRAIARGQISAAGPFDPKQVQPASIDLRLGSTAVRVRASFLPGPNHSVEQKLAEFQQHEIDLRAGAVLERGGVYVVRLQESLKLQRSVTAVANPKSSTGRLDVFTRLIVDAAEVFDTVEAGYTGPLWAEISPRTFGIKVRAGTRLNQIRFRRWNPMQPQYKTFRLSDRELRALHDEETLVFSDEPPRIRDGLHLRVDLGSRAAGQVIGYRAQRHADIIDFDAVGQYRVSDFWEPIHATAEGRLILDPNEFYILASKEAVHVPPAYSAEMVPIDPMMGEFRVHYAGFFDPGFGHSESGGAGSKAVLEVRSYEVPFILEDGQLIGRLAYEPLTEPPPQVYGQGIGSHYQAQGLKLSKHFK